MTFEEVFLHRLSLRLPNSYAIAVGTMLHSASHYLQWQKSTKLARYARRMTFQTVPKVGVTHGTPIVSHDLSNNVWLGDLTGTLDKASD